MGDVEDNTCLDEENRRDLDHAMAVGLSRTRHQMLGDHAEGLSRRSRLERRLLAQTTKGFKRPVADARAAGFTCEQITKRVPGLASIHGPHAAERLFEMVSVAGRVWANAMPGGAALTVMASCATMARTAAILSIPSPGTGGIMNARLRRSPPTRPVWKPMISRQLAACGPYPTTLATSRFALNRSSSKAQGWDCEARVPPHEAGTQAHRRSL